MLVGLTMVKFVVKEEDNSYISRVYNYFSGGGGASAALDTTSDKYLESSANQSLKNDEKIELDDN